MRPPPRSTLFPYTTLFRSVRVKVRAETDLCARCYQPSRSIGEGFSVLSDSVFLNHRLRTVRVDERHAAVVNCFVASDRLQFDGFDIPILCKAVVRNNVRPPIESLGRPDEF